MEGIYPSLDEFKSSLEEIDPVLRNMDMPMPQKMYEDKAKSDQKVQEQEGSLGLAMQSIRDMDARIQALIISKTKVDSKTAPKVLMEDNLSKAKRALMAPKQLCLSGLNMNIQSLERKAHIGEKDESILSKLRETMIRKSREYIMSFPKYSGDSKQGQAWCANFCYHSIDYKVETIAAEDERFGIYGAIETNLRTRVLHLEPGTIGFNSFTRAEYLKEMLGRFMNAWMKGGAKQEFEHKKQGVNEDALECYDTKLQLYLHAYDKGKRNIQEFKRLTLNGLRNLEMMKSCWNQLSKKTIDWAEIRLTIEDQLKYKGTQAKPQHG